MPYDLGSPLFLSDGLSRNLMEHILLAFIDYSTNPDVPPTSRNAWIDLHVSLYVGFVESLKGCIQSGLAEAV